MQLFATKDSGEYWRQGAVYNAKRGHIPREWRHNNKNTLRL